jgi:hypothetical protein
MENIGLVLNRGKFYIRSQKTIFYASIKSHKTNLVSVYRNICLITADSFSLCFSSRSNSSCFPALQQTRFVNHLDKVTCSRITWLPKDCHCAQFTRTAFLAFVCSAASAVTCLISIMDIPVTIACHATVMLVKTGILTPCRQLRNSWNGAIFQSC